MAATVLIRVIQDCICSAFLRWLTQTRTHTIDYKQVLNSKTHTVQMLLLCDAHIRSWLVYNIKGIIIRESSAAVNKEIILEPINRWEREKKVLFYINRPIKSSSNIRSNQTASLKSSGRSGRRERRGEEKGAERGTVSGTNASCNWSTEPVLLGPETCGQSCATSWILLRHTHRHTPSPSSRILSMYH